MMEKCKKKKKGQMGFGAILMTFVAVIVGITLFVIVAQDVGTTTSTVTLANVSTTSAVVNGSPFYITGYKQIDNLVFYNTSGDALVPSTNYTQTNNFVYNGQEVVKIDVYSNNAYAFNVYKWNMSGTAYPTTYVGGAGRSVALLIPIFFALLIAVIALEPTLRSNVLEAFGR